MQPTCCVYSCHPSLPPPIGYQINVDVAAYLVIVGAAIHGRLFVELVSGPRVLPHYSIVVSHTAHVHTLVLYHPCSSLH